MKYAMVQLDYNHKSSPWWVSDLPGCDGRTISRTCPNSDWGYANRKQYRIPLTPQEQQALTECRRYLGYPDPVFYEVE